MYPPAAAKGTATVEAFKATKLPKKAPFKPKDVVVIAAAVPLAIPVIPAPEVIVSFVLIIVFF